MNNAIYSIRSFLILIFAAIFYAYQYLMRSLPARFDNEICATLGTSEFFVSSGQSLYLIIYSIMQIFNAFAFQRFGIKRVLLFALFAISSSTALYAIAWNLYIALIARIITAIFSSIMLLGGLRICDLWFPSKFSGTIICSIVFAGMIGGDISTFLPYLGFKWQTLFLLAALIGVIFVILGAFIFSEDGIYSAKASDDLPPLTYAQIAAMLLFCLIFFISVQSKLHFGIKTLLILSFGYFISKYFRAEILNSEFITPSFLSLIIYSTTCYLPLGAFADVLLTKYLVTLGIEDIYPADSSIYRGMMIGVLTWGPIADYLGFKLAIIISGFLSLISISIIYFAPAGYITIVALIFLGFATAGSPLPIAYSALKVKNKVLARAITNCMQMLGNAIFLAFLPFFFDHTNYNPVWHMIFILLSTSLAALICWA